MNLEDNVTKRHTMSVNVDTIKNANEDLKQAFENLPKDTYSKGETPRLYVFLVHGMILRFLKSLQSR